MHMLQETRDFFWQQLRILSKRYLLWLTYIIDNLYLVKCKSISSTLKQTQALPSLRSCLFNAIATPSKHR